MSEDYLLLSVPHSKGIVMWWRPNASGYTSNINDAGRYSLDSAKSYYVGTHGDAVPVAMSFVMQLAKRVTVDISDGHNLLVMESIRSEFPSPSIDLSVAKGAA